jgi:hypothetical protein
LSLAALALNETNKPQRIANQKAATVLTIGEPSMFQLEAPAKR